MAIIHSCFLVKVITFVSERVEFANCCCQGADYAFGFAPCIVCILYNKVAIFVNNAENIFKRVSHVEVHRRLVQHKAVQSVVLVIQEVKSVRWRDFRNKFVVVIEISRCNRSSGFRNRLFDAQTLVVIFKIMDFSVFLNLCKTSAFKGIDVAVIRRGNKRIVCVIGNDFAADLDKFVFDNAVV